MVSRRIRRFGALDILHGGLSLRAPRGADRAAQQRAFADVHDAQHVRRDVDVASGGDVVVFLAPQIPEAALEDLQKAFGHLARRRRRNTRSQRALAVTARAARAVVLPLASMALIAARAGMPALAAASMSRALPGSWSLAVAALWVLPSPASTMLGVLGIRPALGPLGSLRRRRALRVSALVVAATLAGRPAGVTPSTLVARGSLGTISHKIEPSWSAR